MLIIAKRQYSDAEASGVLTNLRQYFPHSIERNPEHDLQAVISGNLSETVAALALHMFEDGNGLPNARECLREGTALGLELLLRRLARRRTTVRSAQVRVRRGLSHHVD